MKNSRKIGTALILLMLFSFINSYYNFQFINNLTSTNPQTSFTGSDSSSDPKDRIAGLGNNVSVDLFCENQTTVNNFTISNAFMNFNRYRMLNLPPIPGYKIYQVKINIDNSKNLTAVNDYLATSTSITTFTRVQQDIDGSQYQAAGQEFSLPYRSQLYNMSIRMAIGGFNDDDNGTIQLRNNSATGTILDAQLIPVISLGANIWHNYTYNTILNPNTYELVINGTNIGVGNTRQYRWYHPTAGAVALKGDVKQWAAGWADALYNHDLIYCYLPLNNSGTSARKFTNSEVSLKINGTLIGDGNSLTIQKNGITSLNFSSTISCDINSMTVRLYYIKENQSVQTSYLGIVNQNAMNWNITINYAFVSNCINGAYGINITIPSDWVVWTILNGTPLTIYASSNWLQLNRKVTINYASAGTHPWIVNCTAPNYVDQITIEKRITSTDYINITNSPVVNITDTIRINSTLLGSSISTGDGNLTIFDYNEVANYSQVNDLLSPVNSKLSFNPWNISKNVTANGTYIIQVIWFNGTEVGIHNILLNIIFPTNVDIYVNQQKKGYPLIVDWFVGTQNLINITTFYNNTYPNQSGGISTTNATYRITNQTGLWKNWASMGNEELGKGFYNVSLDVKNWANGSYYIGLNLNKTGYQTQQFTITINIAYNTSLVLVAPLTTKVINYYPENLTIEVNYTRYSGEEVLTANVACKVNGGPSLPLIVKNDLFAIRLNSTVYGVGIYNLTIIASQMGYYPRQIYINWTVQTCPSGSTLVVNGSHSQFEFYIGEKISITTYYNDTIHNQPIPNAQATLTLIGIGTQSLFSEVLGYYTWILDSSLPPAAGLWNFSLELKKPNYQNLTMQFEIYVRYNTTLNWFTPPPLTLQPFTNLMMAVNLSHFTLSQNQVPVAGQNIIYSVTTNLGVTNSSSITDNTGIATFSGYIISVGVTSLSIQVIYEGNLTEFPTDLPGSVGILYPTRVDIFVDEINITGGSLTVYKFIGLQSRVNVTVFYYNSTFPTKVGIPAASGQYQIVNQTGGVWVSWTNLNVLGGGYYNVTLDVSAWQNDTYYIGIFLNETGFQMQQFNITMNLVFTTNLLLVQPSSTIIGQYYPENLTIQVNYTKENGDEILTGYVRVIINGTTTLPLSIVGGLYQIQLNSTAYGVGTYNLSIMASLLGFYPRAINVIWIVQVCPTNYQVYVNWSHSPNQFYYGQQMDITILFYDTAHGGGLQYALVNITLPGGLKRTLDYMGSGSYSIILNSSSRSPGLWDLALIIRKPNYQNHSFNLQLYARYDTLLQWLTDFPTEGAPGQTLSLMVRMTHNNGMPVVGQNITFVITTNLGIVIISPIFTNGSGISSDDYVILSGVSTIHIVAIFGGNLTEFSSSITIDTDITVFSGGFWEKYWWTILIGVILAVVVGATVRSRRKAKVVKETKKKEIMSSFQDVTKILHLVVIHKGSGSDIFDYKVQERMDPTLLAGFIQAVKEFGRELDKGGK